jgi:hypothetical protein
MTVRALLRISAVVESGTAVAFFFMPAFTSELLFGQTPQSRVGLLFGRFAAGALLSLSMACWRAARYDLESPATIDVVQAMLLYNVVATGLLGLLLPAFSFPPGASRCTGRQ